MRTISLVKSSVPIAKRLKYSDILKARGMPDDAVAMTRPDRASQHIYRLDFDLRNINDSRIAGIITERFETDSDPIANTVSEYLNP